LQYFSPPEVNIITTDPETPREDEETKIMVYPENVSLVAVGWLYYSFDGSEPIIKKMITEGEALVGNLGFLENGTKISYEICLQDHFFNTGWSDKRETIVIPEFPISTLLPLFMLLTLIVVLLLRSKNARVND